MCIRDRYKPVTNGRRNMTSLTYEEITTNKPEKSLVAKKSKNGGRNNQGVILSLIHILEEERWI